MFQHMKSEFMDLNKNTAQRHLDLQATDGERPFREKRMQHLIDEMLAGRFTGNRIAVARQSGKQFRINGHHTCRAIIDDQIPDDWKCTVPLEPPSSC